MTDSIIEGKTNEEKRETIRNLRLEIATTNNIIWSCEERAEKERENLSLLKKCLADYEYSLKRSEKP